MWAFYEANTVMENVLKLDPMGEQAWIKPGEIKV